MNDYVGRLHRVRHYLLQPQGSGPVRTYLPERLCAVDGCITRLSVYNPSQYCSVHSYLDVPASAVAGPPQREPEVTHRACEHCGREFVTTDPRRRFCSSRCRARAHYDRVAAAGSARARVGGLTEDDDGRSPSEARDDRAAA